MSHGLSIWEILFDLAIFRVSISLVKNFKEAKFLKSSFFHSITTDGKKEFIKAIFWINTS